MTKTFELRQGDRASSLLGLPAEIRNQIWEYVFPAHDTSTSLSLLLTSRQIRAETLLLAYSRTRFATRLCQPWALTQRLSVLSPVQVRAIQSLAFTYAPRTAAKSWDGDWRPLLFPVYVQCRKLLWEAVRLLPGVRSVRFVLDAGTQGGTKGRTVGGTKLFFDTVIGVGLTERSGRGERHAWDERWSVLPGDERAVWLVEGERWVRVEIAMDECLGRVNNMKRVVHVAQ